MSGDPAPLVEPVHSSFGRGAVFSVQQHQLLLGPHCTSFQHALQLQERHTSTEVFLQPRKIQHFGLSEHHIVRRVFMLRRTLILKYIPYM